jgi:dTDP-4-amino-4,6-dideoxygalactose transaminase
MDLKSEYEQQCYIAEFEEAFAKYNGSRYALSVNSGTTALELGLLAAGVGPGDEVILPAYTYISSALAVSNLGARPVFADIQEDSLTISPADILRNISKKTKAVIPVHIHGCPCDMGLITKIALKNGINIIEDCSHAHGAVYKDKKVGNFGVGCFSNHTSKNLSGIGNSGIITTNSLGIYKKLIKMVRVSNNPDISLCKRTPCQADVLQAAILKVKLAFLDKITEKKRRIASLYKEAFIENSRVSFQVPSSDSRHVYRDFVILIKNPNILKGYLDKNGIECKNRYQVPLHLIKYYSALGRGKPKLPVTEEVFRKVLWLPISFALTETELDYIKSKLKNF